MLEPQIYKPVLWCIPINPDISPLKIAPKKISRDTHTYLLTCQLTAALFMKEKHCKYNNV